MEHQYDVGDMLYNSRDNTYNLVLDIFTTPSRTEAYKFLYTFLDLGLGIPRKEVGGIYEKNTTRVA